MEMKFNPLEKVNAYVKDLSVEELLSKPLPDSNLHYIQFPKFEYNGFKHKIFFSNPQENVKGRSYPHLVLAQEANLIDSAEPLTLTVDENPLRDAVIKKLLPSANLDDSVLVNFSGGSELVTSMDDYNTISRRLQETLRFGHPKMGKEDPREIYGTFDLREANPSSGKLLTQKTVVDYIYKIIDIPMIPNLNKLDAHYMGVKKNLLEKLTVGKLIE